MTNTQTQTTSTRVHTNQEPDWEINKKLRKAILHDMPAHYSPEEKAMFIYYKCCKILKYDAGYYYKKFRNDPANDKGILDKECLESIKPRDLAPLEEK